MTSKQKTWYIPITFGMLLIFTISDKAEFSNNKCERMALQEISESNDKIVKLKSDCSVMTWTKIHKPEDSELQAQLLTIWNITKYKKLYFNKIHILN